MSSKTITTVLGTLLIAIFIIIAYTDGVSIWQDLHKQEEEIQQLNTEYEELNQELDQTKEVKQKSQEEVQQLEKEKQKLEQERKRLEAELQAKKESDARLARASERVINTATQTQTASALATGARSGCGDNQYAAYIYGRESGGRVTGNCDTTATNHLGCYGIGQACPAKHEVKDTCGADYDCQNRWFTNYAMSRYGSWVAAYNFHVANGWW